MNQAVTSIRADHSRSAKTMKHAMRRSRQIRHSQEDEYQAYGQLHRKTQPRRNHEAEGDDCDTHNHDRDGMANAPDCSDEGRAADASMARDNCADRDHVIRIASVPHTEHESERDYS
jgi:hypothetical protein